MEVAAVAGQVAERLRHEGRDHPVLLRERVHHVAEEDRAVAARERVREREVLLELAVRVLVVVRVVAPAEVVAVLRDRGQEVVAPREPGHVVAGLLERVVRVGDLDRPVVPLRDEEVLELEPHLELEALLCGAGERSAEDRPRAVRPLLALDRDVAREAREVRLPRDRRVAREVGDRRDVRVAGDLSDLAGGEAGEPRALLEQAVERLPRADRDELRARPGVHVDELREDELDPALLHVLPDGVRARCHAKASLRRRAMPTTLGRADEGALPPTFRAAMCPVSPLRAPFAASPSSRRSRS